jgi:hypothetical protein
MGVGGAELATPGISSLLGGAGTAGGAGAFGLSGADAMAASFAGDAYLPGTLAPINGTMSSMAANGMSHLLGPSNFTAAMAGDAYMPGAMGASGTGTPGMGSWLGSKFASGAGISPRQAMMMGNMLAQSGGQEQRPMGAPQMLQVPQQVQQGMRSQEDITKAWLLRNDPATYARMYGPPPGSGMMGGLYG